MDINTTSMADITEYNKGAEDLFLQFLYSSPGTFDRVKNIMQPAFFEDIDNKKVVEFLINYTTEQTSLPLPEQIKTIANTTIEPFEGNPEDHIKWFMRNFETFCQQKAAKQAVYESMDLIDDNNLSEVVARLKKASEIAIVKDLGIDFWEKPGDLLRNLRDNSKKVSTGWKSIDKKLYGGIEKGTITIWTGQSGAGKSLFLQNQALNWATAGLNVMYISLELSESMSGMRVIAMTTGYSTPDLMKNIDDAELRIRAYEKKHKAGKFAIKQMPNGSNANDIKAFIKEHEIQTGDKVDAVLIDYLDLCSPLDKRVSPSDLYVKDKYVSEELRNIAVELNILLVTASQLNRGSHDEIEFGHQHIGGGISKIQTADNVFAIFTTISMKNSGRYQVQFLKTRSSAGEGSKVDLKYNIASMRITDLEEGEADAVLSTAENILGSLKKSNIVTDIQETEGERASRSGAAAKSSVKSLRDLVKNRNI